MHKSHGGARPGAGRPKNSGKYGEPTVPMRIPQRLVDHVTRIVQNTYTAIPFYHTKIPAGYPLPCDDSITKMLDLNEFLIKHPTATFLVRATGDSMLDAGIYDNDLLIVDRSLEAVHGKIVVAAVDGYLTVKRLYKRQQKCLLVPENKNYQPIDITKMGETVIWGVVIHVIHSV